MTYICVKGQKNLKYIRIACDLGLRLNTLLWGFSSLIHIWGHDGNNHTVA
jgi:hypothetical protein